MNRRLLTLLKFAIGVGLIVLLYFWLDDPATLWRQIVEANPWRLALGALCYTGAVALSGLKWGVLLRAVGIRLSTPRLLGYQWLAEFFNNFLPAQVGGDVMRGYALASDTQRRADAAASVLIDRFIGLLVFMLAALVASVAMLLWGRPGGERFSGDELVSMRFITLGSVTISLALLVLLTALISRRIKRLMERVLNWLPFAQKTVPIWQQLAHAFNLYRHAYRALALTALSSASIVVLTSINIWLIASAIKAGSISFVEVLAINPIIVLVGLLLPISPGGLGVRQSVFAGTFVLIGADFHIGFAVGLLQQLIGYLVSLPGGLIWIRGRKPQTPPAPPLITEAPPVQMRTTDKGRPTTERPLVDTDIPIEPTAVVGHPSSTVQP